MIKMSDIFKKYRRALVVVGRVCSVILSLVLVLFCNMFQAIHEENFNFKAEFVKNLQKPLTWVLALAISLAWVVIYAVVFTTVKEKKILSEKALFEEFEIKNKNRPNNMREYLKQVENVKRKKTAYYDKMEAELSKVQTQLEKIPPENGNSKKALKLKEKEQEIIRKSSSQYVNEHLLSLSVKYNRVSLEHFTFAITSAKVTDKTESNEQRKFFTKIFVRVITGVLISISGVGIVSSLKGVFEWKDTGLWITLLLILVSILMQVYCASVDADSIVDSEIIAPTKTKIKIIDDSLLWSEADLTNKPFEKMINDYIENNKPKVEEKKPVKITLEQLEYLEKHKEEIAKAILQEKGENNEDDKEKENQ